MLAPSLGCAKQAGNSPLMLTDPISDMLTRVRNGVAARLQEVAMPMSRMKFSLAKILEREGFVGQVTTVEEAGRPVLKIALRYDAQGTPAVSSLKRVSTPGRRVYIKAHAVRPVQAGQGCAIISTSNGVMTGEEARKRRLGGELLCEIF